MLAKKVDTGAGEVIFEGDGVVVAKIEADVDDNHCDDSCEVECLLSCLFLTTGVNINGEISSS